MTTISVDLGGTRLKSALVTNGAVIESAIFPMDSSAGLLGNLALIEKEISRLQALSDAAGLAIAFPGIVNPRACRVMSANGKYDDAIGFDFIGWAQKTFRLPLILENDANAALVGEVRYGCAEGCDNAVLMILGTGIGTAAMIEGQLLRGKHFQAGCLGGHIAVNTHAAGRPCGCGSVGCAEATGSTWGVALAAKEDEQFRDSALSSESVINYETLTKCEQAGDALAHRLMEDSVDAWRTCAVNLIHAYDPDILILSGGVIRCGERVIAPIRDSVERYAWTPWGTVAVRSAKAPEHSVILGLHALLAEKGV